jgi:hypothetical protein
MEGFPDVTPSFTSPPLESMIEADEQDQSIAEQSYKNQLDELSRGLSELETLFQKECDKIQAIFSESKDDKMKQTKLIKSTIVKKIYTIHRRRLQQLDLISKQRENALRNIYTTQVTYSEMMKGGFERDLDKVVSSIKIQEERIIESSRDITSINDSLEECKTKSYDPLFSSLVSDKEQLRSASLENRTQYSSKASEFEEEHKVLLGKAASQEVQLKRQTALLAKFRMSLITLQKKTLQRVQELSKCNMIIDRENSLLQQHVFELKRQAEEQQLAHNALRASFLGELKEDLRDLIAQTNILQRICSLIELAKKLEAKEAKECEKAAIQVPICTDFHSLESDETVVGILRAKLVSAKQRLASIEHIQKLRSQTDKVLSLRRSQDLKERTITSDAVVGSNTLLIINGNTSLIEAHPLNSTKDPKSIVDGNYVTIHNK